MAATKKKAARPARATPRIKPTKVIHTQESLLQAMQRFFADADKFMAGDRSYKGEWTGSVSTRFSYYNMPDALRKASDGLRGLIQQLDEVLRGPKLTGKGPTADDVVRQHFKTKPGEPLTWSRPGSAVVWMDDIPVRAEWGGFYFNGSGGLFALDARRMFLGSEGSRELSVYEVPKRCATPEALIRQVIAGSLVGSGGLRLLSETGRRNVAEYRADPANAWFVEAANGQPVDAIEIPLNSPPVQVSLFA